MAHTAARIQRLERLLEVCRTLSAKLEGGPLLTALVEAASELTGCQESSVLVYDEVGGCLRFAAGPWYEMEALRTFRIPIEQSAAGWVFQHSQPLTVNEANHDPRVFRAGDKALNFEAGSILAVPLVFKGQAIGVLEAINKSGNAHYTEEDVTILETLASQAAIAIQMQWGAEKTQQVYQKLVELDRMKADFMAITSHEMRTPLGLIIGHASILAEEVGGEQRAEVDVILRSAARLKEIIEDFSNVDNFKNGKTRLRWRKLSMERVIQDTLGPYREQAEKKHVTLQVQLAKADLAIEGDREKIGIALGNLLKNALQFTNDGGHVLVSAERIPGYVRVSVIDDGIGIPARELPKVFGRFYQAEAHLTRRHGGMGLGLSIAKDMIEMHGGKVTVESVEGQGSNFSILLPVNLAQASAAQRAFVI